MIRKKILFLLKRSGQEEDAYATAAITGTAAIVLRLIGRADSPDDAISQANTMWGTRDISRIGT